MTNLSKASRMVVAGCLVLFFCSWYGGKNELIGPIPERPDYSDSSQWYIRDRHGDVDLFYIISTETGDHLVGEDTCHFADTQDDYQRNQMLKEMHAVDSFYSSGKLNYYSPYYRQVSMHSWASEEMAMARLPLAMADAMRSWDYYLKHFNQERPFVIAGFSQGAHAMLDILKHMPDSVAERMVAAYCIGYKITQRDTSQCKILRPAKGADDTGVTICFNSVKTPEGAVAVCSEGNLFAINPVNWRTDSVSTPFVLYGRRKNDTLSVSLDPESRLLLVKGYQQKYIMSVIGKPGNYHYMELKFYWPYIRQNIAARVDAFMRKE